MAFMSVRALLLENFLWGFCQIINEVEERGEERRLGLVCAFLYGRIFRQEKKLRLVRVAGDGRARVAAS